MPAAAQQMSPRLVDAMPATMRRDLLQHIYESLLPMFEAAREAKSENPL